MVPYLLVLLGMVTYWLFWEARNEPDGILAALRKFLKPDWPKLAVLAVFIFIAYAATVQAWAFGSKELGGPPPPLYDLLRPYPFWIVLVFLLAPIFMISNWIAEVTGYGAGSVPPGPLWLNLIIYLAYAYILSCLLAFTGGRVLKWVTGRG